MCEEWRPRPRAALVGGNNAEPANKDEGVKTGSTRGALADFRFFAFLHSHSYLAHERATPCLQGQSLQETAGEPRSRLNPAALLEV